MKLSKPDIPPGPRRIFQTLAGAGHQVWFVGGCVRDLLRGTVPHDWDLCTSALPEETAACFAGRRVLETGLRHGTVTIIEDGAPYEVTTYRAEGPYSDCRRPDYVRFVSRLEEDLSRRDFAINAIAMDLEGNLRDPFNGAADIDAGVIRCVGVPEARFREDGLRILRALRFSAVLGYEIDAPTAAAIHQTRAVLDRVSPERINGELSKLLAGPKAGEVLGRYPDVFRRFWPQLEHPLPPLEGAPADLSVRLSMLLRPAGPQEADKILRALKFDRKTRAQVSKILSSPAQRLSRQDLEVDGRDVIAAGYPPGPEVGRVLEALLQRVLAGEVKNQRQDLLDWLRAQVN